MIPRERVLRAVRRERVDRTPRDFWAERPAWNRLLARLGAGGASAEERVLEDLGIDIRHLGAKEPAEVEVAPGLFRNHWGEQYVYRQTPWGLMRDDRKGALAGACSLDDLRAFPFPSPDDFDYSEIDERCRLWDRHAIVYGFADVWQRPGLVRGWEEWFIDLIERPDWVRFLCRTFTDFYLEDYARAAEASGGRIDIYLLISDLGTQRGPLISLEMFRSFVAPYLREMTERIHALGGLVLFHSCGAIGTFIPDLIALGVDILDPIQPTGSDMAPERLKADFGDRLCFHGGIDMQRLLPVGTPDEVRAEAHRYCDAFGGTGYILSPAHLFQPDVPPENILAMYA
ncbi:MAG: hypothetical protein JXP34_09470 [Planctomycetes bacterium]|nr:hypothetical protein [Planctomycetota bacterium]